jgi:hypothetical protein
MAHPAETYDNVGSRRGVPAPFAAKGIPRGASSGPSCCGRRSSPTVAQIVRRCDRHRFVVLPKRWIIERTLAWISRCRRLARDHERQARKAAAFVRLAMIRLMLRRVAATHSM